MKLLEKGKGLLHSKAGKIIGFAILGVGNIVALTVGTLAWFGLDEKESKIQMVTGDLDVEIQKVTAYKYVYPYYKNSTEFIDYDGVGQVKPYIIEDHTLEYNDQKVDDIRIGHDNVAITFGEATSGTYSTDINGTHTSTSIYFNGNSDTFRYYLIGDAIFCGDSSKEWSIQSAVAFKTNGTVSHENPAIANDIVVSAGSSFIFFDKADAIGGSCNYSTYASIDNNDTPFRIDNGKILCLRSGIYTFTYAPGEPLNITLNTTANQKDIAVIGNNLLDPTKVTIDYAGSANKTDYPTLNSYLAHAIQDQNTMLILDVQIKYTNANPIDAGLKIERNAVNSASIYNDTNKYNNTSKNLVGYVNEQTRNALRASDFFSFYAVFTKTPYTSNNPSEIPQTIWTNMHIEGSNDFSKFQNDTSYDTSIDCTLNLKDQSDSLTVPGNMEDNIYHCYVGIEYDYIYSRYFLYENRLGKTYLLDRDFGLHFTGVQHLEEQEQGNG